MLIKCPVATLDITHYSVSLKLVPYLLRSLFSVGLWLFFVVGSIWKNPEHRVFPCTAPKHSPKAGSKKELITGKVINTTEGGNSMLDLTEELLKSSVVEPERRIQIFRALYKFGLLINEPSLVVTEVNPCPSLSTL